MNLVPVPTDFRLLIGQVVSTLLGLATVPIICKVAHTIPSAILVDPLRFSQVSYRRHRVASRNPPCHMFHPCGCRRSSPTA